MAVILYTHALTKLSMYTFTTKVMYNIVLHSKQFRLVFGKQIKVSYHNVCTNTNEYMLQYKYNDIHFIFITSCILLTFFKPITPYFTNCLIYNLFINLNREVTFMV